MFDIGFWEIIVIAVVALLVVGPKEFPTLVRNIAAWAGKVRRFMSDTKSDLDKEFRKMDELKQLMEKELKIAEEHNQGDAERPTVARSKSAAKAADETAEAVPESVSKESSEQEKTGETAAR